MKRLNSLILPAGICASINMIMVSCEALNQPLSGSDSSNPLDAPGTPIASDNSDPYGPVFTPGTFLQTVSPSTSFFKEFPKDEEHQPSKILPDYTDVKVISSKGSYVKVEVVDTGEIGFVPSVMLGEKRDPEDIPELPSPTDVPGEAAPDPVAPGLEPPAAADTPPADPAAEPTPEPEDSAPPAQAPEPKSKGLEPPE